MSAANPEQLWEDAERKASEAIRRGAEEIAKLAAEPGPDERYVDSEDDSVRDGYWRIENVQSLDWALSRIADLEREQAENAAIVEEHIQRLRLRLERLNAKAERGLRFFRSQVQAYADAHRHELLGGGKKKSRALPHGMVGWRKKGGGLTVVDREALLSWCRKQDVELGLIRIKEEPAVDEVKRAFKSLGEVPPGCDVEEEREELIIKTTSEEA